jgi:hypothetical protein
VLQLVFIDQPFIKTSDQKPIRRITEMSPGFCELRTRYSSRRSRTLLGAARVIEKEFHRSPFRNMFCLSHLHLLKPAIVTVDDIEAVAHFIEPEIKVRHMPGKLVPVERDEFRDLGRER